MPCPIAKSPEESTPQRDSNVQNRKETKGKREGFLLGLKSPGETPNTGRYPSYSQRRDTKKNTSLLNTVRRDTFKKSIPPEDLKERH